MNEDDYYIEEISEIYKDKTSEIPLICAAASNGDIETVKFMLGAGVEVDFGTEEGETPLIYDQTALVSAAESGHWKVVKTLVEAGADITIQNAWLHSPLTMALFYANAENQRTEMFLRMDLYRNYWKIVTLLVKQHLLQDPEIEKPCGIEEVAYFQIYGMIVELRRRR
ncbi:hypothetical protein LAZ67_21002313 [Cordylochernes scorpioides]|uniref:Uncharacterized protein n=1 Tax=Cordylochernes scorpioides TaxID=51811 RepID=A0ABY6LMM5_9ARAC|nr:hypothetical protein LAZ67_21002313 [Cordylochernes scorpioides]